MFLHAYFDISVKHMIRNLKSFLVQQNVGIENQKRKLSVILNGFPQQFCILWSHISFKFLLTRDLLFSKNDSLWNKSYHFHDFGKDLYIQQF